VAVSLFSSCTHTNNKHAAVQNQASHLFVEHLVLLTYAAKISRW
jgi:hypothetical protein